MYEKYDVHEVLENKEFTATSTVQMIGADDIHNSRSD